MSAAAISPPAPLELGLIAGKYEIERVLGEGGMGVVFAAMHLELEQRVALKVIRAELAQMSDLTERMLLEARTAARFRSEHVARVLDAGRLASGAPYLVMEYLEGSDLASYLADNGRLPMDLAVTFVLETCEAVAEAHAAGVIHRDLKPDNLFLTTRADGAATIKVLDFGISKNIAAGQRSNITQPAMIVGSPDYMSPEQMRGRGPIDGRADVWSLGAVLYELVTDRRPFEAETIAEIHARVLADEPLPLRSHDPSLPDELEAIVLRCLQKDPDARYASVADLACALAQLGSPNSTELADRVVRVASGMKRPHSRHSGHEGPLSSALREGVPASFAPTLPEVMVGRATRTRRAWSRGIVAATRSALLITAALVFAILLPAHAVARFAMFPSASAQPRSAPNAAPASEAPRPMVAPEQRSTRATNVAFAADDGSEPSSQARPSPRARPPARTKPPSSASARASSSAAPVDRDPPVPSVRDRAWNPAAFGGRR